MLRLLAQPQKELQLNLETSNTQTDRQKRELYGSLTTKDLENPHSHIIQKGRRLREAAAPGKWAQAVPHSHVVDKNQEGHLGSE